MRRITRLSGFRSSRAHLHIAQVINAQAVPASENTAHHSGWRHRIGEESAAGLQKRLPIREVRELPMHDEALTRARASSRETLMTRRARALGSSSPSQDFKEVAREYTAHRRDGRGCSRHAKTPGFSPGVELKMQDLNKQIGISSGFTR